MAESDQAFFDVRVLFIKQNLNSLTSVSSVNQCNFLCYVLTSSKGKGEMVIKRGIVRRRRMVVSSCIAQRHSGHPYQKY
jgi:hypothetical protein